MPDVCVLYLSEDDKALARLVSLLGKRWDVWCAEHITHGDWEQAVRDQIRKSRVVVPILSEGATARRTAILRDEIEFARSNRKPVLPFIIGEAEIPFGLGSLNRTVAMGWDGDEKDPGYQQLVAKIEACVEPDGTGAPSRVRELIIGAKRLALPAFVYSVSSHETQVSPADGLALLNGLSPPAVLVSAYDVSRSTTGRIKRETARLLSSSSMLFLDSGNYEAYRKGDRYSVSNQNGWRKGPFREIVNRIVPDVAFSFDSLIQRGGVDEVVSNVVTGFRSDIRFIDSDSVILCPIVHIPSDLLESRGEFAAQLVREVARELNPPLVAIPERELGSGLRSRARAVRRIREELNSIGRYYPLHLLGTGNPLSMIVLAVAGADSFDGLEWCRTAANYEDGQLFHFQQGDLFLETCLPRVRDARTRVLLGDPEVPFAVKVLSYNVDFFNDWSQTMRDMIHSGHGEMLLRTLVPNIGPQLAEALIEW